MQTYKTKEEALERIVQMNEQGESGDNMWNCPFDKQPCIMNCYCYIGPDIHRRLWPFGNPYYVSQPYCAVMIFDKANPNKDKEKGV